MDAGLVELKDDEKDQKESVDEDDLKDEYETAPEITPENDGRENPDDLPTPIAMVP